ncbi:MAG: Na/Pi cotransporter family protein [Candidatus Hydrogenedentes bacterium]|nr:Na/Pi cotransporter family protein [Candidatus Hydrogenedentota bacterium]
MTPPARIVRAAGAFALLLSAVCAAMVTGCAGGAPPVPERLVPDEHASGDGQAALHGTALPQPFRVVAEGPVEPGLLGGKGSRRAAGGVKVRYEVENPRTGAVFESSGGPVADVAADAGGCAGARLILGRWSGDVWVRASLPDFPAVKPVRLRTIGGVERIGEDLETATEGTIEQIGVRLQQPDGSPARGIEVFFRVEGGKSRDSSLKDKRVLTDAEGVAVTSWKLGRSVGQYFACVDINDNREDVSLQERFDVLALEFEAMAMNKTQLTLMLIGGLAIFIFGMTIMSKGLQRMADRKLKSVLHFMTQNRLFAVLAGTVITGAIQSSSAMTVMLIGFVNAGMINLTQAIGVVFGANIGTTVTAQLIAFKLDDLAPPAIAVGLLLSSMAKQPKWRALGESVMGFGLLFLGMTMMSDVLKPLRYSPEFIAWFRFFDCTPTEAHGMMPIVPTLMSIVIATAMTCVIQSSSATVGIVLALCSQGIISFYTAVPLILGDNIGTTITANLAALNANRDAKRVALAHTFFNLIGTMYMFALFFVPIWDGKPLFLGFVDWITPGEVFSEHPENLMRHAANAHTAFNGINVLVFLPFAGLLARFCQWIVPKGETEHETVLQYLEPKLLQAPTIALEQAVREVVFMVRKGQKSMNQSCELFARHDEHLADLVVKREQLIDRLQREIIEYLVELSRRELEPSVSALIPKMIHVVNDAERLGDHAEEMVQVYWIMKESDDFLTPEGAREIVLLNECLDRQFEAIYAILEGANPGALDQATGAYKELNDLLRRCTDNHVKRLDAGECDVQASVLFLDILSHMERAGHHLLNIAERAGAILEEVRR